MLANMKQHSAILNAILAAMLVFGVVWGAAPGAGSAALAQAQGATALDDLLRELARPDQDRWARLERQILREWSRSGSAAIDYLFARGQRALQAGQADEAIARFSAVIDHDPAFAEGWNARATAYFMANRLGQSLADIEQVLILNPHHFGALAGLGMILERLNRPDAARAAYDASLAIHPHQASVREALARLDLASDGSAL